MNQIVKLLFRLSFLITILLAPITSGAQIEMADNFRGEGKIYVVIVIILVILTGFFYMLFKLDKKSKRLEKEIEEK
ncbi:MAG: CcmD family protein [Cyclobacteriaceae bacterium]